MAVIRGKAVPLVDARVLLGEPARVSPSRILLVRTDAERRLGLLVDEVYGVHTGLRDHAERPRPILGPVVAAQVEGQGVLDHELVTLLRSTAILSPDLWRRLAAEQPE